MRLHLDSSTSTAGSSAIDTAQTAALGSGSTRSGARSGDAASGRDSISVSSLSSALNGISSQRSDRIQQLSAAVRSGQYQVSSAALSSSIVGHAVS